MTQKYPKRGKKGCDRFVSDKPKIKKKQKKSQGPPTKIGQFVRNVEFTYFMTSKHNLKIYIYAPHEIIFLQLVFPRKI